MCMRRETKPSKCEKDLAKLASRRLRAMALLSQGMSQIEVARELQVNPASVSRWHKAFREGGADAVKGPGRKGPAPKLSREQWEKVEAKLLYGPLACGYQTELWTLARIRDVVEQATSVRYDTGHLSRILRAMGWSCQKPKRKAKERTEDEIARWVKEEWPRIQGGQKNKEPS